MAKVYNWQIGREMEYWYPEARPKRQWGAVFDLNKCIACQTCTIGCKTTWTSGRGQEYMLWNNVETKPYGGLPNGYDAKILEKLGPQKWEGDKYVGKTIFEAAPPGERAVGWLPEPEDYAHPNTGEDDITGGTIDGGTFYESLPHQTWFWYLPRTCNHCTYPACLASCPRTSIYKRPEDGVVLVDQSSCRGYRECVKNCPYKKVFFNSETMISEKCIGCYPLLEQGEVSRCFQVCIGKIRIQSWIAPPAKAREDNPVDYLVHVRKLALPFLPQLGLEPNVYYIPPIHVPVKFLRQMFGAGAGRAVEEYKKAKDDRMLQALLTLVGSTPRIIDRFRVINDKVVGYDVDGWEVVRVPITEPAIVREPVDPRSGALRMNVH